LLFLYSQIDLLSFSILYIARNLASRKKAELEKKLEEKNLNIGNNKKGFNLKIKIDQKSINFMHFESFSCT